MGQAGSVGSVGGWGSINSLSPSPHLPHPPLPKPTNQLKTHELIIHWADTVISWFSTSS
ncbi:MAG: hypothetical protein RMY29_007045 [Nostoc sp. CreGUA01]|nr:hypothetical protein [Nostoc sp. CreGUA01]